MIAIVIPQQVFVAINPARVITLNTAHEAWDVEPFSVAVRLLRQKGINSLLEQRLR